MTTNDARYLEAVIDHVNRTQKDEVQFTQLLEFSPYPSTYTVQSQLQTAAAKSLGVIANIKRGIYPLTDEAEAAIEWLNDYQSKCVQRFIHWGDTHDEDSSESFLYEEPEQTEDIEIDEHVDYKTVLLDLDSIDPYFVSRESRTLYFLLEEVIDITDPRDAVKINITESTRMNAPFTRQWYNAMNALVDDALNDKVDGGRITESSAATIQGRLNAFKRTMDNLQQDELTSF